MRHPPPAVFGAVEGMVDEIVLRRLSEECGLIIASVRVANGKANLRRRIPGYNNAAKRLPWIILVDLDHDAECAPDLRTVWIPSPGRFLAFRVAVREVEAWLLADRENLARFLRIAVARVPQNPDGLDDPKDALVSLARRSRSRALREDMVPRPGSGRSEGPAYASRLIEFAMGHWDPSVAENRSNSLWRCRRAIERIVHDHDVLP